MKREHVAYQCNTAGSLQPARCPQWLPTMRPGRQPSTLKPYIFHYQTNLGEVARLILSINESACVQLGCASWLGEANANRLATEIPISDSKYVFPEQRAIILDVPHPALLSMQFRKGIEAGACAMADRFRSPPSSVSRGRIFSSPTSDGSNSLTACHGAVCEIRSSLKL